MNIENYECLIDKLRLTTSDELDLSHFVEGGIIGIYKKDDITAKMTKFYEKAVNFTHKQKGFSVTFYIINKINGKHTIELNPSKIGSFNDLMQILSLIKVEYAQVKEIHHVIDIHDSSVSAVLEKLDIKYKRKLNRYREIINGGEITGLYFGVGDHKVLIYDKDKEIERKW